MPEDEFEGLEPVKGLEHLGRAIVDAQGNPSGSPANYEATRGKGAVRGEGITDRAEVVKRLRKEFPS